VTAPAHDLVATPSQTVGPFFHFGITTDVRLGRMAGETTPGERIRVRIRVTDGEGAPLPDAMIELWQTDGAGVYLGRPDGADDEPGASFRGWGRMPTGTDGVCEFDTIRPGAITVGHGVRAASHINVCVFARGLLRHLFTRIYFAGDPAIPDDPTMRFVPEDRRHTLLATEAEGAWFFEVRLQGADETVFFDL
jgi:protocatechuate 3,4-dioxygenase, alpha subunit